MGASAILEQLHNLGVTVTAEGDKLRLEPGSRVSPQLVNELRQNKAEVLAYLQQQPKNPQGKYRLAYPGQGGPGNQELAEIVRRVNHEGYVLLWSTVLEDFVSFYRTEADHKRIPPGFVPYSEKELWELFAEGKPSISQHTLRLVHEAKKQGGHVISESIDGDDDPGSVPKPSTPCYACGSEARWLAPWGEWICEICHPQPADAEEL